MDNSKKWLSTSSIAEALFGPKCIYICLSTTKMWKYPHSIEWTHCQKCNDMDFAPFGNVRYISVTRTSCFTMGAYGGSNSD